LVRGKATGGSDRVKIARRVKKVNPSLTLKITSLAKRMKAEGRPVVNFAAGEPDFDTPSYIKKAAIEAIRDGFTKYTPSTGFPKLKEAICAKLLKDNGLRYSPSQIVINCGAKHSLYNIIQVICEKGDEVLIASPYWVSYPEMVTLAGARARIIKTTKANNFKLNKELIKRHITKKTKLLILNSPSNPTGCLYSRGELQELAKIAIRYNLYVISDEIYEKLIYDGKKHVSIASLGKEIYKRTIVVNGVSKSYAMTGWRIGYLACPNEKVVQAIANLQSHSTSGPCSISQQAALEAIAKPKKSQMKKMVRDFQLRRNTMIADLAAIPGLSCVKPEGAFYVFCNISKLGLDSLTFAQRLLKEVEVAVVPGIAFGKDEYVRMSFATSKTQIQEGMRRIKQWVTQ